MVDKIDILKELLSDFSPKNENTVEPASIEVIDYGENPLNPDLMSYCFQTILGFKVYYRISEKYNYNIHFDYKGSHGHVVHSKFSYIFYIDKTYKDEIIALFLEVRSVLEDYFLDCSKISLNKNEFTLINEYNDYLDKFTFYERRIEELNEKSFIIQEEKQQELYNIKAKDFDENNLNLTNLMNRLINRDSKDEKKEKWVDTYNKYDDKYREIYLELVYSIESYIDVFYSFLEHVLTLLYPLTKHFNKSISYYEKYIHNVKWTWNKKIIDVFASKDMTETIEKLKEIKEIHRNRNAHGSFSKELMAFVSITGMGRYPLYIGKEYLRGFPEGYNLQLSYYRYFEYKEIFNDFLDMLDKEFPIPMIFIKSGLPISVDEIIDDVNNEEEAREIVDRLMLEFDNQLNMDW